jgi:single stranded DNA-binding protein
MERKRNNCEFTGNLTRDPETRNTANGNTVTKFSLAISNDYKKDEEWVKMPASFLDFVLWGDKAATFAEEVTKGQSVNVETQATVESWDDKTTGAKRSKVVFKVWDYEVIERAPRNEESPPAKKGPGRPKKVAKPVEDEDDDVF